MDQVGIRELRANLASIVRLAGNGTDVIVTIDGLPVAQIGPLRPPERPSPIDELISRGQLIGPTRAPRTAPAGTVGLSAGERIGRLVREVRGR